MIPAIVLAAGASSRMGRPKALLPIGVAPETFLTRILRVLREGGVQRTIVVIGGDAAAVRDTLPPDDPLLRIVENEEFSQGQLSSLLKGLQEVKADERGALVTLVDLPLISATTVAAVLDAFRRSPNAPLVRPRRGNRRGHPVIFNRRLFAELRNADPSTGAKPIVRAHADEEVTVETLDDGSFTDVDTPEDYERFIRPTLRSDGEVSSSSPSD